jgi:serine/threonine protein kinase/Tol biopolymer transport system component
LALTPGTRLGVYEVTAPIGEGGMGQVYRARDTKLNRDVALKILPDSFANDPDRLARFTREARTLASLNHPNIAHIHGLEEFGGVRALVMELVEGDDLSQRIAGGAIPLDDALPIAKQIAQALEAAHEQGIIHRDLKPPNIKVRSDGTVKVLDFGLAKAVEPAAGTSFGVSNSPTITTPAMTQAGMILGTAAYMSPEQVRGKTVDKRADIWAFGCVLYEILTGERLFAGDSVPETLGLIFSREPDLATLPAATSARVRTLIVRCLVKDPRQRLRDIGDARLDLEDARDTPDAAPPVAPTRVFRRALPWGVALAALLLAGWALWGRSGSSITALPVTHLEIGFPHDVEPGPSTSQGPAISSDGRTVAMIGVSDGVRRAFVRRLDREEAIALPGAGANGIVFSPDGGSVAVVFASGLITRISLTDQQRKDLTSGADVTAGIAWSQGGIVFGRGGALWVVSLEGGAPRALTVLDAARHEVLHARPVVLPGERLVLFASQTTEPGAERIESVSIDGGPRSVVVERATTPVWSSTGHLLFSRDGAVLALAFDARSGTPRGVAVPVLPSGAVEALAFGQLALTLSSTGTLVLAPVGFKDTRVVSVSRDGATLALDLLPSNQYANPRISPDGRRLLVEIGGNVIEALDLARGTRARLTAAALGVLFTTWSVDGARVVFRRFGGPRWAAADGSGDSGPVPNATATDFPSSPGPDPDSVIILRVSPETSGDVFLMSMSGAFEPKPLIVTPAYEGGAQLSPDGRWLLYQSDASGRAEIYVRRYPALDRQWQVSEDGGVQPRWSRNNREIYYRGGGHLVAASLDASGAEPVFGKPTALFTDDYDFGPGASIANYDVTRDGRFIMIRRGANGGKLRVIVNWTEELKQILAAGGLR